MDRCLERQFSDASSFPAIFDASGALWPENLRNSVDAMFSDAPLGSVFSSIADHYRTCPSELTVLMFAIYTGGQAPATPADAAFSMTGKLYGGPWSMWRTPEDDAANWEWHERCVALLAPMVHGYYISESNTVRHPEYVERAFAEGVLDEIERIRGERDPHGRFFGFYEGL